MVIPSVTNNLPSRSVTPTSGGQDRHAYSETHPASLQQRREVERQAQARAAELSQQERQVIDQDARRRLDGRLFTFGNSASELSPQQQRENRAAYMRERVRDTYSNNSYAAQRAHNDEYQTVMPNAIDYVV